MRVRVRGAEQGGDPEPHTRPRRRPGTGSAATKLARSGSCFANLGEKSLPPRVFSRSPAESGGGGGRRHRGRWARGSRARAVLGWVWGSRGE